MSYNKIPKGAKNAICKHLKKQFSREVADKKWNKIQDMYNEFQEEQPYIGGKHNPPFMNIHIYMKNGCNNTPLGLALEL